LSCLVLSCLVLSCPVLSCLSLFYLVFSGLVSACLVLSCIVLSCLIMMRWLFYILSCLVLSSLLGLHVSLSSVLLACLPPLPCLPVTCNSLHGLPPFIPCCALSLLVLPCLVFPLSLSVQSSRDHGRQSGSDKD
jgi:hypothetical protein